MKVTTTTVLSLLLAVSLIFAAEGSAQKKGSATAKSQSKAKAVTPPPADQGLDTLAMIQAMKNQSKAKAMNNQAMALAKQDKLDSAITLLHAAVRLDSTLFQGYANLGSLWLRRAEPDSAIAAMKRALKIRPSFLEMAQLIALSYEYKADTAEARHFFSIALKLANVRVIQQDTCATRATRAYLLKSIGDETGAAADLERLRALGCDPALIQHVETFSKQRMIDDIFRNRR